MCPHCNHPMCENCGQSVKGTVRRVYCCKCDERSDAMEWVELYLLSQGDKLQGLLGKKIVGNA